jgi:signal transduction histidine kinase
MAKVWRALTGLDLFGSSLSARVLWLTVSIILLVEIAILFPSMGRERETWLWAHITQAHLAAFAAEPYGDGVPTDALRDTVLRLSGAAAITLTSATQIVIIAPDPPPLPGSKIDLANETLFTSTIAAAKLIAGMSGTYAQVTAPSPMDATVRLDVIFRCADLATNLRDYAIRIAALSVIIALMTGLMVFAALDRLLVRPMRIMTASIVGFRKDPEHASAADLGWLSSRRTDEIALASRELRVMQDEMRAALWRNARLAALGTAVAKISHDLRNILSSALLVADRLSETSDPAAQKAAGTLIPAVERAAQLVSRTVDFAREGPPAITRSAVIVRYLVEETVTVIRASDPAVEIANEVPANLILSLDRDQIYRVLINLMRNAVEAGADQIRLAIKTEKAVTRLVISDNGPGLPLRVQDNLFKPFTGSGRHGGTGLGLAIARDLIRAHGGELVLDHTSPRGTVFIMDLATSELQVP